MATALAMPLVSSNTAHRHPRLPIATASGFLALLSEPDPTLVQYALTKLLSVVDTLWHEIAEALPDLEAIAEGGSSSATNDNDGNERMMVDDVHGSADAATHATHGEGRIDAIHHRRHDAITRQKAAALASRVFFHLEEPRQALRLALESGSEYFNVLSPSRSDEAYVERLVNAAIGEYVRKRREEFDCGMGGGGAGFAGAGAAASIREEEEEEPLDMDKLQRVVHLMFERCYQDGHYGHALGVAFESMERTKVAEILDRLLLASSSSSDNNYCIDYDTIVATLKYALHSAQTLITSKNFRVEALSLVALTLEKLLEKDVGSGDGGRYSSTYSKEAACTLVLCRQLMGDDMAVGKIITRLIDSSGGGGSDDDDAALLGLQLCFDIVDSGDEAFVTKVAKCLPKEEVEQQQEGSGDSITRSPVTWAYFANAHRVLTGGFTSELSLSFLYKNSNFDTLIMNNL